MARYTQSFKERAVARMLPPENASVAQVSAEMGISPAALERWRAVALAPPPANPPGAGEARLDAVLATGAMGELQKTAWCRENAIDPTELECWRQSAAAALADNRGIGAVRRRHEQDQKRIRELERELRRKEQALAETATLLVLTKNVTSLFAAPEDKTN
ncbi:transposase [Cupriavidus basilensis]|uniref:transposase n=2 Tax=Cupriavidus basilensis TaxID=68895 RepID=UPI002841DF8C|nr:transposase [Cupriavidus basilensis]MDR3380600.1 transposase [Cupriavidus basilensis]